MPPLLSIIIPAHNEETRLPDTLPQVLAHLARQDFESELLVVDSGSTDGTRRIAEGFASGHSSLQVIAVDRPGKGLAVRHGMLAARGKYRFICDADLSMPIEEINRFFPPQLEGVDISIASRELAGAIRYDEPAHRHLIGRVFNTLVRVLATPGIQDTQCGFKCFRGEVAQDLFSVQRLEGWTFDVEVLFIARQRGYRILEIPIPWYYRAGSRVRVVQDSFHMLTDLFRIRYNGWRGRYQRRAPNPT